jgi:hypothetical protein
MRYSRRRTRFALLPLGRRTRTGPGQWRLAHPECVAQMAAARERSAAVITAARGAIAAAAAEAARRALQLVEGVRAVTPRGAPVPEVLVGGDMEEGGGGRGGEHVTLQRAEVIPEHQA